MEIISRVIIYSAAVDENTTLERSSGNIELEKIFP